MNNFVDPKNLLSLFSRDCMGVKEGTGSGDNQLSVLLLAGLQSEGLYRVSGFSEHIEDVRLAFDRGLC